MPFRFFQALIFGILILPLDVWGQNGSGFSPEKESYLWPTNASTYLSSTFAETRSRHFHAALDLKTWGRRGYHVYATRDGLLHRIAIGPKGYGKVVYLRHDDGSYSLYAHLMRFEDSIQQIADSIRMKDYSFELDKTLDSLGIRVKQGDIIGLSGASGIGPPHLHFELRTPDDKPFNPLLTNLRVRDTIAPKFTRLSVEPLSMFSKVEGNHQLYTKRVQRRSGSYSFNTIRVEGSVGLGVDVYDQANDVYNAYAVYELKMYVNGEPFFHSKVDSFAYNETDQMFLDRVYPILKDTRAGFQRLYVSDGNTLPFYRDTGRNGHLNLGEGTHQIRIVASDFYGNTSEATLRLQVRRPDTQTTRVPKRSSETGLPDLPPTTWTWFDNWVSIPEPGLSGLVIAPLDTDSGSSVASAGNQFVNVDLTKTRDVFFRRSARDHFIVRRVYPDAFSIVPATTHNVFATFDPGVVYDTLSLGLTVQVHKPDSVQINVIPDNQPVRKPFMLAYEADSLTANAPNIAFYAFDKRRNKFNYLDTQLISSHLIAYPENLGTFYALSDTLAPSVKNPAIERRPDGHWKATVAVHDNLAGIDHRRSEFHVNGIRGIAEYEPENNKLIYYHPDFKPEESNRLEVIVYDKVGNKTRRSFFIGEGCTVCK